jgi:uncharacterized protein YyaL (SSP411 family)
MARADIAAFKTRSIGIFIANDIEGVPQEIAQKTSAGGSSAWICEGFSCRAPIDNIEDLLAELETVIA